LKFADLDVSISAVDQNMAGSLDSVYFAIEPGSFGTHAPVNVNGKVKNT
jgi:hypothetical protein